MRPQRIISLLLLFVWGSESCVSLMMMSLMSISGRLMAREVQYPWGEACWENLIFFIGSGSDIEDGEALNLGPISCLEGWHMCNCAIVHWSM